MGLRRTAPNNDARDDVLIDIVVYERPLFDATSNRQTLKHLQRRMKSWKREEKHQKTK